MSRSQNWKILIFSARNGHIGLLNKYLEVLILDTEFRYLLALNGHNGVNTHLAVNPTPHHRFKFKFKGVSDSAQPVLWGGVYR